jgi:hypothetical protein
MEELFGPLIISTILNLIGGTLRFIYGTIWRTIFNKPKFTYKQYIYGIKSKDFWEGMHQENNKWIGGIFVMLIVVFIANYA